MLDVEYAHSSNSDSYLKPQDCLIEVKPAPSSSRHQARSPIRTSGQARTVPSPARNQGQVRLFALADISEQENSTQSQSSSAIEQLAVGFRAAPEGEPLGVTLGRLIQAVKEDPREVTAVVACTLCFDRVLVAHIGNAGCYLIRQSHATRLTARDIEVTDHQILPGDVLLLCCEGLPLAVKGSEMATVTGHAADLNAAIRELLALATERSAHGKMSALMIRVRAIERSTAPRGGRAQAYR